MKISDLFVLSIQNLWRRKLRTSLTLLGVIIGTASIVIMISLGIGMQESIMNQIKDFGSLNVISVNKNWGRRGKIEGGKKEVKINDELIREIEKIPGVTVVSPVTNVYVSLKNKRYVTYVNVQGVKKELLEAQGIKLEEGKLFDNSKRIQLVLGSEVPYQFRDPNAIDDYGQRYDANGKELERKAKVNVMKDRIDLLYTDRVTEKESDSGSKISEPKPIRVKIIGKAKSGQQVFDYSAYTSLEAVEEINKEKEKWEKENGISSENSTDKRRKEYNQISVYVEDGSKVKEIQKKIKKMGVEASSMVDMLEGVQNFSRIAQTILGGIGAVSLFVAALGIANTMVMSIYERTKEIGVMKVIGASLGDIKKLFLSEAALIGLIGGVLGLVFSGSVSALINFIVRGTNIFGGSGPTKISIIPIWLYLMGMTFTTIVGLGSGYFPARRAMKLSVLKALRNE